MRLSWDKETKTLCSGAGLALAAGLLMGGAMHPDLGDDGRPAGPQIIAGWAGVRSTGPFDPGLSYASYAGQIPDYVLGTDWKKTVAYPAEPAATSGPSDLELARYEPPPEQVTYARAEYEEPPPAPKGRYPSTGGETPPHAATGEAVDADEDQAPAVTG